MESFGSPLEIIDQYLDDDEAFYEELGRYLLEHELNVHDHEVEYILRKFDEIKEMYARFLFNRNRNKFIQSSLREFNNVTNELVIDDRKLTLNYVISLDSWFGVFKEFHI